MDKLEIAKLIEFNFKAECQAIFDYIELIKIILASDMTSAEKTMLVDAISEIVADEENHQNKLHELCTHLTGIEPKKD